MMLELLAFALSLPFLIASDFHYRGPFDFAIVVARDDFGDAHVSTVLLPVNHRFFDRDAPGLWYETMIFMYTEDGEREGTHQWRATTRSEALEQHERGCRLCRMRLLEVAH